jgi:hypothetical protein
VSDKAIVFEFCGEYCEINHDSIYWSECVDLVNMLKLNVTIMTEVYGVEFGSKTCGVNA